MNAFELLLRNDKRPELISGIPVTMIEKKLAIKLPLIDGAPARKTRAFLDKQSPAAVVDGRIYEAYLQMHGGTSFRDNGAFVTVKKPRHNKSGGYLIMANTRWFDLDMEILAGNPNGSVAPGSQIIKPTDSISFVWEGKKYIIFQDKGKLVLEPRRQALPFTPKIESNDAMLAAFEKLQRNSQAA